MTDNRALLGKYMPAAGDYEFAHYLVNLDEILSIPVVLTDDVGTAVAGLLQSVPSTPPGIVEARFDVDEAGRQMIIATPISVGETVLFFGPAPHTGTFIRLKVVEPAKDAAE
jgi:hypothetical protein